MDIGVVVVQRQCPVQRCHNILPDGIPVFAPIVDPGLAKNAGAPGMSMGIIGVERDGPVYQSLRPFIVRNRASVMQHLGSKHTFIRGHICRFRSCELVPLSRFDTTGQRGCDRRSHLVLNREYVIQLPVKFVCPNMSVIRGVDELNRHAHPVADLADTSFHEVLGAKLLGDLAHIHRGSCKRSWNCVR